MHFIVAIYYIIFQKCVKFAKNWSIVKKAQTVVLVSYKRTLHNFKTIEFKQ